MSVSQAQESMFVHGYNAFLLCMELMIYIFNPQKTRSVNGIL